jgi:hypothetical protein
MDNKKDDSPPVDAPPVKQPLFYSQIERVDPKSVPTNPRFQTAHSHRCNPALDRAIEGLVGGSEMTWKEWRHSVGLFVKCMRSDEGKK